MGIIVRSPTLICKDCGSTRGKKRGVKGSLFMEIALWLFFLLPGIIYSIWRLTTKFDACKDCGSATLLPIDSPMGQKLAKELGIEAS